MMYVTGHGNTYWRYWWVKCTLDQLVRVNARVPGVGVTLAHAHPDKQVSELRVC